jgi:hypothetical protein
MVNADLVKLESICNNLGLIAMRDEGSSRWYIGMKSGSWSYVRITSVSDFQIMFTSWGVIEKQILEAVMRENFET